MKPHPRIRKTIKCGGAAVTVLLLAAWFASAFGYAGYVGDHGGIAAYSAQLEALWPANWESPGGIPYNFAGREGWNTGWSAHLSINLGFELFRARPMSPWTVLYVPLWAPAGVSLLLTALAFRLDSPARRRARLNLCPNCNYDRTGLAAGAACPECGVAPLHKAAEKQATDDTDTHG